MTDLTLLSPVSAPAGSAHAVTFLSALAKPSGSTHPITFLSPINAPSAGPAPSVSIDLSALPASLTVGTPVSFNVTASNVDGATGAITISAASLPPGMSISATTGTGPYTATISGTPTTEAVAADWAISASNGTQSASANWNVAISAAATGGAPTRTVAMIHKAASSVTSDTFTGVAINAGDLVIVKYSCRWGVNITGVTDTAGKCTFAAATADARAVSESQQMFYAIATGAAATDGIRAAFKGSIDTYVLTLEVYSPPAGTSWTFQSASAQFKLDSGQTPSAISSDPATVSGNGLVAILCGDTRGIADAGFTASPGTIVNSGISQGGNAAESVEYLFTGGLSAQVLSANVGGDAATPQDDWTIKALIVAPFTYS